MAGVDCLPDRVFSELVKHHNKSRSDDLVQQMCRALNSFLADPVWPRYFSTAKVVPLSKTDSSFPNHKDIRTIAVLPTITKVFELRILEDLTPILYGTRGKKGIIHTAQQGFRPGAGCEIQLVRILNFLEQVRSLERENRAKKIPVRLRQRVHLTFVDLRKAYDLVNRDLLLAKMLGYNLDPEIITFVAKFLATSAVDVGERMRTFRGLPQGSCLSPALFNIYINDLISLVSSDSCKLLLYADDILIVTPSQTTMSDALTKLSHWCTTNGMEVNKDKSAVLVARLYRRTRAPSITHIESIPIQRSYKYLGV